MFDERFEVFLADTAAAHRLHFRLRYRIYCEERGYEPSHRYPDRQERDAADDYATHFLVRAKSSGAWVATMRLLLPGPRPFPIQEHCDLYEPWTSAVEWGRCGELSRLGILRRQIAGNGSSRGFHIGQELAPAATTGGPHVPEIMFGLLRAAHAHNRELGLDYCLWMSSLGLARLLKRYRLPMRPLGDPCYFRGTRQPFIIEVEPFWKALVLATRASDPYFHGRQGYLPFSALASDLPEPACEPYPALTPSMAMVY